MSFLIMTILIRLKHILSSVWLKIAVVVACIVLAIVSVRASGELFNAQDFDLGKGEQLRKAERLLDSDSIEAAFVLFNLMVADFDVRKRISDKDVQPLTDAFLHLGDIHIGRDYNYPKQYNDYAKAYTAYSRAADLAEKHNLNDRLARALLGLAGEYEIQLSTHSDSLLTDTLFTTLKRSLHLAAEANDRPTVNMAMKTLAMAAFPRNRGKEITEDITFFRSLPFASDNEKEESQFVSFMCSVMDNLDTGNLTEALAFTDSLRVYAGSNAVKTINAHSLRIETLFRMGRKREVLAVLDSLSAVAAKIDNLWFDMQIEQGKSAIYGALGMKQKSDSCLYRYYDVRERLFEDRSASRIRDLQFMNRIDEMNMQVQKITLERLYARRMLVGAIAVAIVFAIMLMLLWRYNRRLKESHERIFRQYQLRLNEAVPDIPIPHIEMPSDAVSSSTDDETILHTDIQLSDDNKDQTEDIAGKYRATQISEADKERILISIRNVLSSSQLSLSPGYQLKDLATEAGEKPRYISQVINERCGCNFATFLAEHRIAVACRRITESEAFRRLTVEAMAESVGIQSRSYFSTTFKKIVGLSPSEYIRQVSKDAGK